MKTLARGLRERLDNDLDEIFKHGQYTESTWAGDFAQKLDKFTVFLGLTPYKPNGVFHRKISSISQKSILPVRLICPPNVTCTTGSCKPYHLSLSTRICDIPQVQLIEGSLVYEKAYPLTGEWGSFLSPTYSIWSMAYLCHTLPYSSLSIPILTYTLTTIMKSFIWSSENAYQGYARV